MAATTLSGLTIGFGDTTVIEGLDLQVDQGRFFTLLGPSGCGKTTLLRVMARCSRVGAGTTHFDRQDMTHVPTHRRDIGMVFRDYALLPGQTVFDNGAFGLRARGVREPEIRTRVARYLDRVGLAALA